MREITFKIMQKPGGEVGTLDVNVVQDLEIQKCLSGNFGLLRFVVVIFCALQ